MLSISKLPLVSKLYVLDWFVQKFKRRRTLKMVHFFCFLCQDVSKQLWSTLYDFPELQNCIKLKEYMDECVRLSWMMAVQIPPMIIEYEATEFSDKLHGRFMTSDMKSLAIKYHVWPALIDSQSKGGYVLYRGVVVT